MRKLVFILCLLLCIACDSENALDCIQARGDIISVLYETDNFERIRIEDDVSLLIKQGPEQEVIIETGENLLNDVSVTVEDGTLVIRDANRCNLVRGYGITRAVVTTPDLKEIRNSSEFHVVGEGVLRFRSLRLISNTTEGIEDSRKSGDFTMTVQCENFRVDANGFSIFKIDGFSEKASIGFEDEIPRFEGANFRVNDMRILHRSANLMIINPRERLRGEIRGTGDVISVNRPPIVEVEEFFTGLLIFQD